MQLLYKLNEEDYLAHHLFSDSKNDRLRKRRTMRRFIIAIVYAIMGIFLLLGEVYVPAFLFLSVALLYTFFYNRYSYWLNKRHYKKHVQEQYKNNINKEALLYIDQEELRIKDESTEIKIKTTELASLSETVQYYYLRTKSNSTVILPKHTIQDQETLHQLIDFLRNKLNVTYHDELNWRWK